MGRQYDIAMDTTGWKKWLFAGACALGLALAAMFAWRELDRPELPASFASGNGRIEATEIDIAAKQAGRISEIRVDEADFVEAGQVLARMDVQSLEAELAQAQAQVRRARSSKITAASVV